MAMRKPSPSSPSRLFAGTGQSVISNMAGVGGRHAHLGRQVFAGEARSRRVSTMKALMRPAAALGIGKGDDGVGDAAVGDQVFHAVEDEVVAAAFVGGLHFQRVAAGVGLGQAEGQDLFAAAGGRQIAAFCSSLPQVRIGYWPMEVWPEKKVRTPVPSRPMRARARA